MFKVSFTAAVVAVSILLQSPEIGTARAAEIQFLCAAALKSSLATLIPEFEKSSGDKVSIVYGTVGGLTDRILKGDAVDVAILSGPAIEELQKSGKVVAGSRTDIAKVGVGVFVRKGAARPDLSSTDAVKHSMLAARSIAYSDPAGGGSSGIYMASLVNRLDIAAEMKPRTKFYAATLYENVASGDVEIGFNLISEIVAQPSVDFVGPLPAAIQSYTLFSAGIVAASKQADAARALVRFLSSPTSVAFLKARGFE